MYLKTSGHIIFRKPVPISLLVRCENGTGIFTPGPHTGWVHYRAYTKCINAWLGEVDGEYHHYLPGDGLTISGVVLDLFMKQ